MSRYGRNYKFAVTGLIAILIIIVLALNFGAIKQQLSVWKLLPEPERLTELYFTHPNILPGLYTSGQPISVSFTTHNLEYNMRTYTFRVIEISSDASQQQTLASGVFILKQNQSKSPIVSVTPIDLGQKVQIEVKLINVNESIDYWLLRDRS